MIGATLAGVSRLITGATAHWLEAPAERQRVYFANHASHLDFVIIWSALPPTLRRRTRPVAGADYWDRGALRRYLARRVFRAILIDRAGAAGSPATATRAIEQIAEGMGAEESIIVFPEGTRSLTGELQPFKSGIFHLARLKPGLEFVPTFLANMNRILPKGEVLPVPLIGRVVFGAPIRLESDEDKQRFLTRAREALLALGDR